MHSFAVLPGIAERPFRRLLEIGRLILIPVFCRLICAASGIGGLLGGPTPEGRGGGLGSGVFFGKRVYVLGTASTEKDSRPFRFELLTAWHERIV